MFFADVYYKFDFKPLLEIHFFCIQYNHSYTVCQKNLCTLRVLPLAVAVQLVKGANLTTKEKKPIDFG